MSRTARLGGASTPPLPRFQQQGAFRTLPGRFPTYPRFRRRFVSGSSEKGLVKRPFLVNGLGLSPTARISRESWHFLKVRDLPGALESEASHRRFGRHAGVGGRKSLRALERPGGSG